MVEYLQSGKKYLELKKIYGAKLKQNFGICV